MAENRPVEEMAFGEAIAELEQIVRALEGGQLELEDSLARYERGVTLIAALQQKLTSAEQRVTALLGQIQPEPPTGLGGDTSDEG